MGRFDVGTSFSNFDVRLNKTFILLMLPDTLKFVGTLTDLGEILANKIWCVGRPSRQLPGAGSTLFPAGSSVYGAQSSNSAIHMLRSQGRHHLS